MTFSFDFVRIHLSFIAVTPAFDHLDTAAADIKLRSRPYPDYRVPAEPQPNATFRRSISRMARKILEIANQLPLVNVR